MKHTATPFYQDGDFIYSKGNDERDDIPVCDCCTEKDYAVDFANAEFIVRACNNHEELVETCKAIIPFCLFLDTSLSPDQGIGMKEAWHKLQQALDKATKD